MHRSGRLAAVRGCEGVLALVLANARGRALEGLTAWQTKAAVPFGGQYRIVDFALSNCVNSEIRRIALLTQYKSQSLIRHVHGGWGFLHRELGAFVEVRPAQQQDGERWYRGTVDAVCQNSDLIEDAAASHVLVLAGDQIYALDYAPLIELHAARNADLTVACAHVPACSDHDEVFLAANGRIDSIEHRPPEATAPRRSRMAPMGVYLFSGKFLVECLTGCARRSATAVVAGDVTPSVVSTRCRVGAGAVIRDSVLLPRAIVGDGCILDRVVVDCDAAIPPQTMLGTRLGADSRFFASPDGIVLATAGQPVRPVDVAARAIA